MAVESVERWLDQPNTRVVLPTERHWPLLGKLLRSAGVGANLTTDAHLAALAIEHGCTLCSNDGDFERFEGLRWENPLRTV
jgi:predicted nucleic acid-binding protein